ncbi:MAG: hypothetical protein V2A75_06820 [Pseudomonadota bacterium]
MRNDDERITLFCKLFALTSKHSRTTAGRKINKKKGLAPFEEFFKQLSNKDLQNLLDFLDKKSTKLSINMRRDEKTEEVTSTIKVLDKLETITTDTGKVLQFYVPRNKSPQRVLEELWSEQDRQQHKKNELYRAQNEEYEDNLFYFSKQDRFQSFNAYLLFLEGLETEADSEEMKYRSKQNGIYTIDYANYLSYKLLIERYCENIFAKQISTLSMNESNKEIINKMIITHKSDLLLILDSSKMDSEFVLHLAKEKLLKLLKKHRVLFD